MPTKKTQGLPVLIIGAGRDGSAMLAMFLEDSLVNVVAIADSNPDAPGLQLAKDYGVPTYDDAVKALQACKEYPDCIAYNLTNDDSIAAKARKILGDDRVAGGPETKLLWQMITSLTQSKADLEKSVQQLQSIIHNVMDGIILTSESGELHGFNPAAEEIFGYTQQEISGLNVKILMPESARDSHGAYINHYRHTGQSRIIGVRGREVTALRKNGEEFPMEISVSEMVLGEQRYFVGVVRDITERKRAEQKISHLAHFDYLTDLPNRASFMEILNHSILLAKRNREKIAVLFLDLDGFKQVNDTLGHEAGDRMLQEASARLRQIIRASDVVARVGGDEFTFELYNIGTDINAAKVTNKIIAALSKPYALSGHQYQMGGSIGISMFPDDADDPASLIRLADEAMYMAKRSGKNTYRFCRDMLQERAAE